MSSRCRGIVSTARSCVKTGRNVSRQGQLSSRRISGSTAAARSTATAASTAGKEVPVTRGGSRSRGMLLSALAAFRMSGMGSGIGSGIGSSIGSVATVAPVSSSSSSAAMRMLSASAASTVAMALVMPQGTGAVCAAARGSDDDDEKKGADDDMHVLLRIAKSAFFGNKGATDGKKREIKDGDEAKKLFGDLVDSFNGFGGDMSKAVDGTVKRKTSNGEQDGIVTELRSKINEVMASGAPSQISFGFLMGIGCGFAAKKTAKVALVGVGLAFGSLQLLSYLGYVELDYTKIEGEMMGALDLDDNGKVDMDDAKELFNRAMKVAAYNLPAGSGFAAGALFGARMG